MKPLFLVVGVGPATGATFCRLIAERYHVVMVARSTRVTEALVSDLPEAIAYTCDVADREAWQTTLGTIRETHGVPTRILVNTESAAWGAYNELSLGQLATSFDVNVVSLLQLVQVLFPTPGEIPADTRLMVSSSPAAYTPPARFLGLAPSRVAQRVLAELLHENLSDSGLSFSVFSINGAIDEVKMRSVYPDKPDAYFIQPADIARNMLDVFDADAFVARAEIRGESSFA